MRILILGGAGFVGREVVRALSGHMLWVLHRSTAAPVPTALFDGVNLLQGDLCELHLHHSLLKTIRPEVVLDMASMNANDAQRVVSVMAGAAERAVIVSSGSVYDSFGILSRVDTGAVDNTPRDENASLRRRLFPYRGVTPRMTDAPRRWLDDYDKILAERAYLGATGLPSSVIRLPMVYGPGDPDARLAPYLRRMLDGRPAIVLHQAGAAWRNARAFVTNAAHAIATVVLHGQPQRVYNVSEPEDLCEADWIRALGREIGWKGRIYQLPMGWDVRARPRIDELPAEADFAQHLRMDSTRIRTELDYIEPVSLSEALGHCIAHAREVPPSVQDYSLDDLWLEALVRGVAPSLVRS